MKIIIKLGSRGTQVSFLQNRLNTLDGSKLITDGSFGPATRNAVMNYQRKRNQVVTGSVNEVMWDEIQIKTLLTVSQPKSQPVYRKFRAYDSDIHVYNVDPKTHFLDVELGVKNRLERPSVILNNLRKSGKKKAIAITNCGFFVPGGTHEHIGLYIDEGLYYNPPSGNFVDFEYYKTGKVEVKNLTTTDTAYLSKLQRDCLWAIGTSYALLIDGKTSTLNRDKFDHSGQRHPRTLIGYKQDGTLIVVVVDGRTSVSRGVTANQSEYIMRDLNCYHAVNVDGGGSSVAAMVENDRVVIKNRPSDKGFERAVGSVLVVYEL
jgi:peptidoglycan hydrolase-like protein with peptidoglycan-binding domain